MDTGPVGAPDANAQRPVKERKSWKLKSPHDTTTQGIVVSGFDHLPFAEAIFLFFDWPEDAAAGPDARRKGAWLETLNLVAPVSNANGAQSRSCALAFTWTGLKKMGLGQEALSTFSAPFREGMYQEDRLRRLGDRIKGQWQETVIPGGSLWGANTPVQTDGQGVDDRPALDRMEGPAAPPEHATPTPTTVHALLLLYESDRDALDGWCDEVAKKLMPDGVRIVRRLSLDLHLKDGIGREHFGFADGLSQPIPFGDTGRDGVADDCVVFSDNRSVPRDPFHGVPLGEILLGHVNGHHERAPGPMVPNSGAARAAGLRTDNAPEGFRNFGLDGSYLVVRELRQYVARFWNSLEKVAQTMGAQDPRGSHLTADWLAERIIGRNIDGHLLCPSGVLAADAANGNLPQNSFAFLATDPHGFGCPMGSHVRRGNPRDGLAKDPASAQTLLDAANNHRILRRGRKFGPLPSAEDRLKDDNQVRGLLFMCLNTDIARQFEFVQQTWMLNRDFATLFDEVDPLIGPKGQFTIPDKPLRRIAEIETFVQMAGGDYFFLPSIPAIKFLAAL